MFGPSLDFTCAAAWNDGQGETIVPIDFFQNFIHDMLVFFNGGEPVAPKEETLAVIAILEAATEASKKCGSWVKIPDRCE